MYTPFSASLRMVDASLEPVISIDADSRQITIPQSLQIIGTEGDQKCETVYFEVGRYFDEQDLSVLNCKVRCLNAKKEYNEYKITDITTTDDTVKLGWLIDNFVTRYAGTIEFTVQFEERDEEADSEEVQYQWQTAPANLKIRKGIDFDTYAEPVILVDAELRKITIPTKIYNIGVEGDQKCETIFFKVNRYFDGEDLSTYDSIVRFVNAGNEYYEKTLTVSKTEDVFITLKWEIDKSLTRYSGIISFTLQFQKITNDVVEYQWQTLPAELNVLKALNIDNTVSPSEQPMLASLTARVDKLEEDFANAEITSLKSQMAALIREMNNLKENVVYILDDDLGGGEDGES